jgi:hypothetical protein
MLSVTMYVEKCVPQSLFSIGMSLAPVCRWESTRNDSMPNAYRWCADNRTQEWKETVVPNTGSEYSSVGIAGLRFLSIRVHVMLKEVNNVTWRKREYRNVCCRRRDMVTAYMVMRCAHWTLFECAINVERAISQYHAHWKTSLKHGGRLACLLSVLSTCWKQTETYRDLYVNWYPYLILFSDSESTMM